MLTREIFPLTNKIFFTLTKRGGLQLSQEKSPVWQGKFRPTLTKPGDFQLEQRNPHSDNQNLFHSDKARRPSTLNRNSKRSWAKPNRSILEEGLSERTRFRRITWMPNEVRFLTRRDILVEPFFVPRCEIGFRFSGILRDGATIWIPSFSFTLSTVKRNLKSAFWAH